MRSNNMKSTLKAAILAVTVLLLTAGMASAQNMVNLTASQQTTILPDGNSRPDVGMDLRHGRGGSDGGATCTSLTYNTATGAAYLQTGGTTWQPPLIVVPYVAGGTKLDHQFHEQPARRDFHCRFSVKWPGAAANGGMGTPVREAGPRTDGGPWRSDRDDLDHGQPRHLHTTHARQARALLYFEKFRGCDGRRGASRTGQSYTWTNLNPGTYLIRSGTYPSIQGPMGLYGVLVVTAAPAAGLTAAGPRSRLSRAVAYRGGVTYDADVVALESELDPRQNNMVAALFPVGGQRVARHDGRQPLTRGSARP